MQKAVPAAEVGEGNDKEEVVQGKVGLLLLFSGGVQVIIQAARHL